MFANCVNFLFVVRREKVKKCKETKSVFFLNGVYGNFFNIFHMSKVSSEKYKLLQNCFHALVDIIIKCTDVYFRQFLFGAMSN
jgi:hypothetical protein